MTISRTLPVALALAVIWPLSTVARADEKNPRVAVVNLGRVFNEMRERKDVSEKMKNDLAAVQGEDQQRQGKIKQLKQRRDVMEPTAPDYQKISEEFSRAVIEYEVWKRTVDAEMQLSFKNQLKMLADKIEAATSEVAKAKGIEIVIVDQRPDLPPTLDEIPVERLKSALNQRTILYLDPKVDISSDVLAAVDARYKAGDKPAAGGAHP